MYPFTFLTLIGAVLLYGTILLLMSLGVVLASLSHRSHCEDVVDLAVVIPTAPTETDRRCVVRDSWARQLTGIEKETGRRVKLYFTIGDSSELPSDVRARLDMEKAQFSDIHELVGFADSYNRLGLKVIETFKVAEKLFGKFRLLLKTDTDSYVHLAKLLSILDDKKAFDLPRVYAGEFWSYLEILQPALKTSTGLDYYPTNARGAGYVLSYELVNLVAKSPVPFKQVDAEDAMIGLFLAPYEYERISYEVQPMTPQCGCAITCLKDKWESKGKNYYIDHYNKRETLRWKQRRYELFGDSCWKLEQEREEGLESCRRATLQIGDDERFYFDTVTRASIPDGVIVADHTSTRSGVCKVTFQWAPEEWGSCSKDCGGGVRRRCVKCSGPDGHAFDDVECDSQTRPSDEESCNEHACPKDAPPSAFLSVESAGPVVSSPTAVSSWVAPRSIASRPAYLVLFSVFLIIIVAIALGAICLLKLRREPPRHPGLTAPQE